MDLLYSRYSNPMDLIKQYIKQRRFKAFVSGFVKAENERRQLEADRDTEMKLWIAYIHSYSDETYATWRGRVVGGSTERVTCKSDTDLDDEGIQAIIDKTFSSSPRKGGEGV